MEKNYGYRFHLKLMLIVEYMLLVVFLQFFWDFHYFLFVLAASQKHFFEEGAHSFEKICRNGAGSSTGEENFEIENLECLLV